MSSPEFSSETAVTMYLWQLVPQIAQRLSVQNWEFLAVNEQLDGIGIRSKPVGDALRHYLELYREWATADRAGRDTSRQWQRAKAALEVVVSAVNKATKRSAPKVGKRAPRKKKRQR